MLELIIKILEVSGSLIPILYVVMRFSRKIVLFLQKIADVLRGKRLYYVNSGGSIQRVIDRARPKSRVVVKDGTYIENIKINKEIVIESESGPEKTVIQAKDPNTHIFYVNADNTIISGLTIRGGTGPYTAGIFINANNCTIKNNKIMNNNIGVKVSSSRGSFISGNEIRSNGEGIQLDNSSENEISSNVISGNEKNGIVADDSISNKIKENRIELNIINGIIFNNCKNNIIYKNIIRSNANNGILINGSQDNVVTGNTISSNRNSGILLVESPNNIIYYNNFVKNVKNVEGYTKNIWSSPSPVTYSYGGRSYTGHLGNYWSDYKGIDEDEDGIGDTPHRIGSGEDSYPLVKMIENYIVADESLLEEFKYCFPIGCHLFLK